VRAKLHWTPTDDWTVDLAANYIHADGSLGLPLVPIFMPANAAAYGLPASTLFAGLSISRNNTSVLNDANDVLNYDIAQGSVKAAYDIGPATLISITGYSDYQTYNSSDFDLTASNILAAETKGAQNGGLTQVFNEETKQFSEELRAVSAPGRFRYVAGLWVADKRDDYTTVRGPLFPGLGTHTYANYTYNDYSRQYAGYGQSEYDIVPDITVVTGLRVNDEAIGYTIDNVYKKFESTSSHSQPAVTGKASVEYRPLDTINLFASYTRGYKGETYDLTSSFNAALAAKGPVQAETSNSYEIGAKTQFFGRRLTVDVTGFDTQYSNFQAQTIVPTFGTGFILANVGSLETRGVEIDGRVRVSSNFSVDFAGTYLDATIQNYPLGQCYYLQTAAQGCVNGTWNLAGQTLPNAPKFKGNLDAQYSHDIPGTGFEGVVTGSVRYQTAINYSLSPDPLTAQSAFAIVNLGFALQPTSGPDYKIGVFVNNLFDTHYYAGVIDYTSFSAANSFGVVPRDYGRYGGVRLAYAF
jgi:iron complex outermembrane receptor protein